MGITIQYFWTQKDIVGKGDEDLSALGADQGAVPLHGEEGAAGPPAGQPHDVKVGGGI